MKIIITKQNWKLYALFIALIALILLCLIKISTPKSKTEIKTEYVTKTRVDTFPQFKPQPTKIVYLPAKKYKLHALARWKSDMPKCFKVVFMIAACLLIFSIGVNLSLKVGLISQEYVPVWWLKLSPYLIGSSGGISFLAKFTRDNKTVDEAIDSVTKKINDNQYPDK